MARVSYPDNSPYSATPQTSWYLQRMVWRPIPPNSGDTLMTLLPRHQYRPDKLSFELYNTGAYFWVFCVRNPYMRIDPVFSFIAGSQVWCPSNSYLKTIVG